MDTGRPVRCRLHRHREDMSSKEVDDGVTMCVGYDRCIWWCWITNQVHTSLVCGFVATCRWTRSFSWTRRACFAEQVRAWVVSSVEGGMDRFASVQRIVRYFLCP